MAVSPGTFSKSTPHWRSFRAFLWFSSSSMSRSKTWVCFFPSPVKVMTPSSPVTVTVSFCPLYFMEPSLFLPFTPSQTVSVESEPRL